MAFTVKLFVHGVPEGKKQWGIFCKEDQLYLDQFYQDNKDIQEYMKVECRKSICFLYFHHRQEHQCLRWATRLLFCAYAKDEFLLQGYTKHLCYLEGCLP